MFRSGLFRVEGREKLCHDVKAYPENGVCNCIRVLSISCEHSKELLALHFVRCRTSFDVPSTYKKHALPVLAVPFLLCFYSFMTLTTYNIISFAYVSCLYFVRIALGLFKPPYTMLYASHIRYN